MFLFYGPLGEPLSSFRGFNDLLINIYMGLYNDVLINFLEQLTQTHGPEAADYIIDSFNFAPPYPFDIHLLVASFNLVAYGACWIGYLRLRSTTG